MNVAIVAASGMTGTQLIEQALAAMEMIGLNAPRTAQPGLDSSAAALASGKL